MDKVQSTEPTVAVASPRPAKKWVILLLLAGAVCAGMGQTIVFSVLPPIAREIGISDFQVVTIFMVSAICWVICVPQWGRQCDQHGRKPFIITGLAGFAISMLAFGAVIHFGLNAILAGTPLYLLLIATRSLYGLFGSAGPPAAQAYIADRTSTEDRTAGIASYSAAVGFGAILGPGFGAGAAYISKTAPFFAIAVLAAIMAIIIAIKLPEKTPPKQKVEKPRLKITDIRVRPFLIFGLAFGAANAIPVQTIAFYMMDVLNISTDNAPLFVGIGLMGGAMAALASQMIIVRRMGLPPRRLLRIAPVLVIIGHGLIWATPHLVFVILGMILSGFAAGMAIPGFNAAASLAVNEDEQGAAIGLAGAAGASGFIISPIVGVWFYQFFPALPYICTTLIGVFMLVFALRSRAIDASCPKLIAQNGSVSDSPIVD